MRCVAQPDDRVAFERARELVDRVRDPFGVSFMQRHLGIGYGMACRVVQRLEAEGVIVPVHGTPWLYVANSTPPVHQRAGGVCERT